MPIFSKRWCEPRTADDGYRLLICRTAPRTKTKTKRLWDGWCAALGPSALLEQRFLGKKDPKITAEEFEQGYRKEMAKQKELIDELASLALEGKAITLLCAKTCSGECHCHRLLLQGLIEDRMKSRDHATIHATADATV